MKRNYEGDLLAAFYAAATFLKHRVEQDGWTWSSNYLREHVRCATGLPFSNSRSPELLRALRDQYPEFKAYIEIGDLKQQQSGFEFRP